VTHLDIAYVVHVFSQFFSAPTTFYWGVVLRILKYLRGTQFQPLLLSSKSSSDLCAYCNTNWNGDPIDRKSTTDWCIFLSDSLISWKSINKMLHLERPQKLSTAP